MRCRRRLFLGTVAIESNFLLGTDKVEESYTQNIQQVPRRTAAPGSNGDYFPTE